MQSVYLQWIMKYIVDKGYEKQTQNKACPERSRMGQFPKGQNELKIACRKIWPLTSLPPMLAHLLFCRGQY